jgi:hypothetical protein
MRPLHVTGQFHSHGLEDFAMQTAYCGQVVCQCGCCAQRHINAFTQAPTAGTAIGARVMWVCTLAGHLFFGSQHHLVANVREKFIVRTLQLISDALSKPGKWLTGTTSSVRLSRFVGYCLHGGGHVVIASGFHHLAALF